MQSVMQLVAIDGSPSSTRLGAPHVVLKGICSQLAENLIAIAVNLREEVKSPKACQQYKATLALAAWLAAPHITMSVQRF